MLLLIVLLELVLEELEDVGGDDEEPVFLDGEGVVVLVDGPLLGPEVGEYFEGGGPDVLVDVDQYPAVVVLVPCIGNRVLSMNSTNFVTYSLMELKLVTSPGGREWAAFRSGCTCGGACVDFFRMLEMSK